jgi:hypothetical protein
MTSESNPVEVVQSFFSLLGAGEVAAAKRVWAEGAIWHLTGSGRRARDYRIDDYVTMLAGWVAEFRSYHLDWLEWSTIGDLVYATGRSTGGEAPGIGEGLVVYRVVGGRIAEGWGIPSDPRYGF